MDNLVKTISAFEPEVDSILANASSSEDEVHAITSRLLDLSAQLTERIKTHQNDESKIISVSRALICQSRVLRKISSLQVRIRQLRANRFRRGD